MNPDTHIYLYAKGWYQTKDPLEDMRIIVGNRCGMPPNLISDKDVLLVLSEVTYPYIGSDFIFIELMFDLLENKEGIRGMIKELLRRLIGVKTSGLDLGEPDPIVLPLSY